MCRNAAEGAIAHSARKRLLSSCDHADAEDRLRRANRLQDKLSIALFGDRTRPDDATAWVADIGEPYGPLFTDLNTGTHHGASLEECRLMVRHTGRLVKKIDEL